MLTSRRTFLKCAGALAAFSPLAMMGTSPVVPHRSAAATHTLCYFTKHLQWLDFADVATVLSEAGFGGADLTVRPGGHVEPDAIRSGLPQAIAAFASRGLTVPMVASGFTDAGAGMEDYLRILADHDVRYYRLGYLRYDHATGIDENIARFRETFLRIAEKNARYGVTGVYQNHAGEMLGSSLWDLRAALDGIPPEQLGVQFDVRHAVYEGGRSWTNDLRAIAGHVRTFVLKDFTWKINRDGQATHLNIPLGDGIVPLSAFARLAEELRLPGPVSIHSEYPLLTEGEETLGKTTKMDLAILRLRRDVERAKAAFRK